MQQSSEQALEALRQANAVRTGRKELKAALKDGSADPRALFIDEPSAVVANAKVGDALTWVPWIGRVRARQITMRAGVNPSRRLAGLTTRQRVEIALRLPS